MSFVSYIDAIGELDGKRCLIDWKTTTSRYSEEPEGLLSLDPQLDLLFLDQRRPGCCVRRIRSETGARDPIPEGQRSQTSNVGNLVDWLKQRSSSWNRDISPRTAESASLRTAASAALIWVFASITSN